jgi:hypothetical protein
MRGTLKEGEPHPMAANALNRIRANFSSAELIKRPALT